MTFFQTKLKPVFPWLTVLFSGSWLLYFLSKNNGPVDPGDGLLHYFIAQASWKSNELFLDHWGKPLFTLLSSPFAQFGHSGSVFFNILVFLATCVIAILIFRKFDVSDWLAATFPFVLLSANEISKTVLGGLTEPLFNFLLIAAVYAYVSNRRILSVILLSLLPFARSEGLLVLALSSGMLILFRQWRLLPYLLCGFIVYAVIGLLVGKSFFWYFQNDPYRTNGLYGHGSWMHYLISYRNFLGNPGLYFVLLVFIYFGIKLRSILNFKAQLLLFIYASTLFFGIVVVHSYLWATGQKGAYGLTRLGTQGMPLFIVSCILLLDTWKLVRFRIGTILMVVFSGVMAYNLMHTKLFPQKQSVLEKQLQEAAQYVKKHHSKAKVVAYHPCFSYYYHSNPYYKYGVKMYLEDRANSGTIVIYDSQFGSREAMLTEKIRGSLIEIHRIGYPSEETHVIIYSTP